MLSRAQSRDLVRSFDSAFASLRMTRWVKTFYDESGNAVYAENSNGATAGYTCDANGNCIYIEESDGNYTKNIVMEI